MPPGPEQVEKEKPKPEPLEQDIEPPHVQLVSDNPTSVSRPQPDPGPPVEKTTAPVSKPAPPAAKTMDKQGKLISAQLSRSSGSQRLDKAALATIRRAAPFPKPPQDLPGDRIEITAPVEFFMR